MSKRLSPRMKARIKAAAESAFSRRVERQRSMPITPEELDDIAADARRRIVAVYELGIGGRDEEAITVLRLVDALQQAYTRRPSKRPTRK